MRFVLALGAVLGLSTPAMPAEFDVAPTTLDLKPGAAGLFYVSNRGKEPVTVQLEPMDWTQSVSGEAITPSSVLRVSPQFATIPPGARQSVRIMASPEGGGEHHYRLLVNEIPSGAETGTAVRVLLQFSVPVFVGHNPNIRPALRFNATSTKGSPVLDAYNEGGQAIKLTHLSIDGVPQPSADLVYILPGVAHRFEGAATRGTVTAQDARTGDNIRADITTN